MKNFASFIMAISHSILYPEKTIRVMSKRRLYTFKNGVRICIESSNPEISDVFEMNRINSKIKDIKEKYLK